MELPDIDLIPIGINGTLTKGMTQAEFNKLISQEVTLNTFALAEHKRTIETKISEGILAGAVMKKEVVERFIQMYNTKTNKKDVYRVERLLGRGTYGEVYECIDKEGRQFALKQVLFEENPKRHPIFVQLQNFMKECIIQIILAEMSDTVPDVFSVAIKPGSQWYGFIITEYMDGTAESLISRNHAEENDIIIPTMLLQVAAALEFYETVFQFNHRDLKANNIMFKTVGSKNIFKLIDFGYSCLTWNSITVSSYVEFGPDRPCFKKGRDLEQLIYYFIANRTSFRFTKELLAWLKTLLVQELHDKLNTKDEMEWKAMYRYLNRNTIDIDVAVPAKVKNAAKIFLAKGGTRKNHLGKKSKSMKNRR